MENGLKPKFEPSHSAPACEMGKVYARALVALLLSPNLDCYVEVLKECPA